MKPTFSQIFRLFLLLLLPFNVYAWNPLGHMVIANIAYQQLTPAVQAKVDALVATMAMEYPVYTTFPQLADWADDLKAQKVNAFSDWHFIDNAFSNDGTPVQNIRDTDNAEWAISQSIEVIKNTKANSFERARFLAFLAHIVGDLHQPFHTVTLFSATHPQGDKGGNYYTVQYNNQSTNLHMLWDSGVGIFSTDTSTDHMNTVTANIVALYPESSFNGADKDLVTDDWVNESVNLAKQDGYDTPEFQPLSAAYVSAGQTASERQAALAGYRLAALLNLLLG